MAKAKPSSSFPRDKSFFLAIFFGVFLFCVVWSFTDPFPNFSALLSVQNFSVDRAAVDRGYESAEKSFYDDPELSYTIDKPVVGWDQKRREWLKLHPSFGAGAGRRVLLLSGSQPLPCKNSHGDHLLLRFFKNKVDYCRIHGYDIFYSNAFLKPDMRSFLGEDSGGPGGDVGPPGNRVGYVGRLGRYLHRHGFQDSVGEWSMEFLDVWAAMGPQSPDYKKWGEIQRSTLKNKMFPDSDDQSALVYLLLKGEKKWTDRIYVENEYSLHGYWRGVVGRLNNITERYVEIERREAVLRRRHAEAVTESYAAAREPHVAAGGDWREGWRRPFITHFTGCQPCSGDHNPMYEGDSCQVGMERALNFADNQVLRNFGFSHSDLDTSSPLLPLPYAYPAENDFEAFSLDLPALRLRFLPSFLQRLCPLQSTSSVRHCITASGRRRFQPEARSVTGGQASSPLLGFTQNHTGYLQATP
nr:glycosyltransferase 6-like [Ipomoea batatas]